MNTGEAIRLTLIVLAGIQTWNAVLCYKMASTDQFLNWLQTHSNNENAVYEYTHGNPLSSSTNHGEPFDRNVLISQIIPDVINSLERYRYVSEASRQQQARNIRKGMNKRNFAWQPMGGPLPVETRLVAFGSRLGPGNGDESGSSNKAMRYGR